MRLLPLAPLRHVLLVVDDSAASIATRLRCTTLAAEVVASPSPEAAASALAAGRRFSAVLVGRVDPDLAGAAARVATPVLPVSRAMTPEQLAVAVGDLAGAPVPQADWAPHLGPATGSEPPPGGGGPRGRLVAVCGSGGTGVSSVAAGLAAALGRPGAGPQRRRVLLADFALRADQAFLHHGDQPATGLLDLVAAGRYRSIGSVDVFRHTVAIGGGRLLPGLRHPEHWTAVSPAGFDGMLTSLLDLFDVVVADLTGDFEGEAGTGSVDIEERNHMARASARGASVVVAVGGPGALGGRRLALVVDGLLDLGVDPARIQPVVNRLEGHHGEAPRRSPVAERVAGHEAEESVRPPFTGRVQGLEGAASLGSAAPRICGLPAASIGLHFLAGTNGAPLPPEVTGPVATAVAGLLTGVAAPDRMPALVRVTPGSLGCAAP